MKDERQSETNSYAASYRQMPGISEHRLMEPYEDDGLHGCSEFLEDVENEHSYMSKTDIAILLVIAILNIAVILGTAYLCYILLKRVYM